MKKAILIIPVILFLAATVMFNQPALAQAPQPTPDDDSVNAVAKNMYCPVCENIPLDVCPTTACKQWRELIREKLALGWDEGQIQDYMALQYGDRVLAEPPRRGLHWLVYILPPLFLLAGVIILVGVLGSAKRKAALARAVEPPAPPDDPYLARLEEELHRREREN